MATSDGDGDAARHGRRALVLAGGGVTGIAWELGVLHGLAEAGLDLRDADVVVGTSAGAAVGAQLFGGPTLAELYARQCRATHREIPAVFDLDRLIATFEELFGPDGQSDAARARVGAMALAAETVPEPDRRAVIEWRLPDHRWPDSPWLRITAVDATTGELVVFDGQSGVGLVDAVAASCAVPVVWPPVTIGDRRFMDGGVRSPTNADLVEGYERVVILAPLAGPTAALVDVEVAALRSSGSTVVVIGPGDEAQAAMGDNPLDPSRRPPVAEAGRRQAAAVVDELGAVWTAHDREPASSDRPPGPPPIGRSA